MSGVQLAVDDFGSGFSSLRSLRRLPVQRLKIDSGFIANVPSDPADTAIVSAILGLARQLKLGNIEVAESRIEAFDAPGRMLAVYVEAAPDRTLIFRSLELSLHLRQRLRVLLALAIA